MSFFMNYFICNEYMIQICVIKEIFKNPQQLQREKSREASGKSPKRILETRFPCRSSRKVSLVQKFLNINVYVNLHYLKFIKF